MPLNLCNAFLKPARASKDIGLDFDSSQKLIDHMAACRKMAAVDKATYFLAHQLSTPLPMEGLTSTSGYSELVEKVVGAL
jgi:hypothetical protein